MLSYIELGVHPGHYNNSWYDGHIDIDASRVIGKFLHAEKSGLNINEVSATY